jgi:hypothetical protein
VKLPLACTGSLLVSKQAESVSQADDMYRLLSTGAVILVWVIA